jgi:hypothetical protein
LDETANQVLRRSSDSIKWDRIDSDNLKLESVEKFRTNTSRYKWLWYRRPFEEEIFQTSQPTISERIARNENEAWMWNGILALDRKKWINYPLDNWLADKKIQQLSIANQFGMKIPKWIVTGSKEEALRFAASLNWNCIIKPLSIGYYSDKEVVNIVYTSILSKDETFDGIEFAPVYLQEAIEKQSDVRTVFCNGELIFIKIISPNLDCRKNEMMDCKYEIAQAPKKVISSYLKTMKYNRLRFSTSDFVIDQSGEWIFLEHNPNGNWLWMDEYVEGACLKTFVTGLKKC